MVDFDQRRLDADQSRALEAMVAKGNKWAIKEQEERRRRTQGEWTQR